GVPGATNPDRQLWVAATLYRVGVQVHELLRGPLDDDLADELYAASAHLGTALQLPAAHWPADRTAFERYWADAVQTLQVGDDARAVARDLLHPRHVPAWVRAAMPLGRTLTAGLLPASVREGYGLPAREGAFRRAVRLARVIARVTPRRLRELPSRRLLR
ncbi:MAG: oxygenase MpaB family protein, partial [Pseudolysinimonas sp.]